MFNIEVVASSVQSCINAQTGGARRIELCSALATAGVTPSAGLTQLCIQYVTIPVYVMIRPREGDFVYSRTEIEVIKRDIENLKIMGAEGVVLGVLNSDGTVNHQLLRKLVEIAKPMAVTFHRAIDITPDAFEALESIIDSGCERILTSGGKPTGLEGKDTIIKLAEKAAGRISIMPGGGINENTIDQLFNSLISEYHLSGREPVHSSIPSTLFEMDYAETSTETIKSVVAKAKKFFFPS